jgi:hypothetical protein
MSVSGVCGRRRVARLIGPVGEEGLDHRSELRRCERAPVASGHAGEASGGQQRGQLVGVGPLLAGCYVRIVQFGLLAGRWFGAKDVACPAVMLASAGSASRRGRVPGRCGA